MKRQRRRPSPKALFKYLQIREKKPMPLYDYRCKDCDKTFELLLKISDTAVCPACGGQNMEKLVSRPAAPGQSAELIAKERAQAASEGQHSGGQQNGRALQDLLPGISSGCGLPRWHAPGVIDEGRQQDQAVPALIDWP